MFWSVLIARMKSAICFRCVSSKLKRAGPGRGLLNSGARSKTPRPLRACSRRCVEERRGIRRFHHGGRIEGAVPERTVSIVGPPEGAVLRKDLGVAGGMRDVLDIRVEVLVPTGRGQGACIGMAECALAACVDWVVAAVDEEQIGRAHV